MSMRTRRILLMIAIPLAVLTAAVAAGVMLNRPTDATADVPQPKYILSGYEGMVAVFLPGSEQPSYVTDAPVSCLPAADRKILTEGLPVFSEEELTRLLEDYGS